MNPALTVLALLSVAGLLVPRRRLRGRAGRGALAWAVAGLAAMALLAPALSLPDGIPSPAGSLSDDAPWASVEALAEAPGNPILRDVTYQIQPWLLFLRGELRAGRLPFWNPHQAAGTPYWGNGQGAPLFPLHLLFALLPSGLLGVGWVLLPWLRLMTAAMGARALAREIGLGELGSLYAGLGFALSGMLVGFVLFPMGNALALVPWILWATERLAAHPPGSPGGGRAGRWAVLAALVALQLLAGHPETAVHTALVSALYLAVRLVPRLRAAGGLRRLAGVWGLWGAAWVAGAAVAAVQILPLALTLADSSRWQAWEASPGAGAPLGLLLAQPLRLVLPELYGNPVHGTWWGPFNYLATAVYAGVVALPLAGAGLGRCLAPSVGPHPGRPRDEGDPSTWPLRALAAVGLFAFVAAYHLPGLRELLVHLPLVGRAAHHRLLFALLLALAVLGGAGLDAWRRSLGEAEGSAAKGRGPWRGLVAGAGVALGLLVVAWALHRSEWAARDLLADQLGRSLWLVLVTAALVALPVVARRRGVAPRAQTVALGAAGLVLLVTVADLVAVHGAINPGLPAPALYPTTGAVELLAHRPERVVATGRTLHPNAAMVYGLYDVRGDDPVKLARYETFYGERFGGGHPTYFRPPERLDALWLDRLSVRWVMSGPGEPAPGPWRLAYDGADARIWERSGAMPFGRWAGGGGSVEVLERSPGRWRLAFQAPARGGGARPLLVVGEVFARGWRARLLAPSAELPVEAAGDLLLGVRPGVTDGVLELHYRPPGIVVGAVLSLLGLLALLAAAVAAVRSGRRRAGSGAPEGAP